MPLAAACPLVSLQDDPANTSDYSCGVTRNFGGPNSSANKIDGQATTVPACAFGRWYRCALPVPLPYPC